jgi:hypothetical protein
MAINLQRFMSTMNQQPPAKTSNFDIQIFSPLGSVNDLSFRAESVALPGRSISTSDYMDVGPITKVGYSAIYLETSINFILSERYNEKEYFDQWVDAIVGPHRVQKNPGGNKFNAGYYDTYAGTIVIQNYSTTGQPTYKTKLIEAFPLTISPVQLDWGTDDISKLNVTFTYRYYEHTNNTVGGKPFRDPDLVAAGLNGSRNALKGAGQKALEDYAMTGGLDDGAAPTNTAPDFSDFSIRSSGGTSISSGGRIGAGSATGVP